MIFIPKSNKSYRDFLKNPVDESFVFKTFNRVDILEMGAQLKPKNSSGIDNISSKQLKEILPSIVNPVTHIFNLSFQTGYIPLELKTARVVPRHKSDSNSLFNNYRPISLLPSLSKLLEKCAAKQMFGFIEKNKILYDFQFGLWA